MTLEDRLRTTLQSAPLPNADVSVYEVMRRVDRRRARHRTRVAVPLGLALVIAVAALVVRIDEGDEQRLSSGPPGHVGSSPATSTVGAPVLQGVTAAKPGCGQQRGGPPGHAPSSGSASATAPQGHASQPRTEMAAAGSAKVSGADGTATACAIDRAGYISESTDPALGTSTTIGTAGDLRGGSFSLRLSHVSGTDRRINRVDLTIPSDDAVSISYGFPFVTPVGALSDPPGTTTSSATINGWHLVTLRVVSDDTVTFSIAAKTEDLGSHVHDGTITLVHDHRTAPVDATQLRYALDLRFASPASSLESDITFTR